MTGPFGTTAGPWSAWSDETDLRYIDSPKYPTAKPVMVYADEDCESHAIADCSCNHTCRMDWECEANARAIAQVPPMLELMARMAKASACYDGPLNEHPDYIAARAIVAELEKE